MNIRKKIRHNVVMSHLKMGNDNRNLKAKNDARMWKEECAKANKELEATTAELQNVKGHLDQATNVMNKVKKSLL